MFASSATQKRPHRALALLFTFLVSIAQCHADELSTPTIFHVVGGRFVHNQGDRVDTLKGKIAELTFAESALRFAGLNTLPAPLDGLGAAAFGIFAGGNFGMPPRLVDTHVREVSEEAISSLYHSTLDCINAQKKTLAELNSNLPIDFFLVSPDDYSGYSSDKQNVGGFFKIKRPPHLNHVIEEIGTRRSKHYREFPATVLVKGKNVAVGVYFMPAHRKTNDLCVTQSAKEIQDALKEITPQ